MADARQFFKIAMFECTRVNRYMQMWADKIDDLQARSDWDKISKEIFNENKSEINREIRIELENWQQERFFDSGYAAGKLEIIFITNAPKNHALELGEYMIMVPF